MNTELKDLLDEAAELLDQVTHHAGHEEDEEALFALDDLTVKLSRCRQLLRK